MNNDFNTIISKELELNLNSVNNTIELHKEGATIPFIARYRKEKTNGLNEVEIKNIIDKYEYYQELEKRRTAILKSIDSQGKLTQELKSQILSIKEKQTLEDIYLPYKPKKRTRATIAKEKGLEPLAKLIWMQLPTNKDKESILKEYLNDTLASTEEALNGALDIIAEWISEETTIREYIRKTFSNKAFISSSVKKDWKDKKSKFENYYNFSELLKNSPSHRLLAIKRGAKENVLSFNLEVEEEQILSFIETKVIKNRNSIFYSDVLNAIKDSYKRLISPSIESEVLATKTDQAEMEAIEVFSKNLKNLLLNAPAGSKNIIGLDPGFRTGCKVAVIDKNNNFKENQTIFPNEPLKKLDEAEQIILNLIKKYNIELIAIGNGTASKETHTFVKSLIKKNKLNVVPVIVNEAGASIYSASELAQKEFPDLDLTVRGAISIARRLQDPLAELVKIDAKSIGVGQYQHDVNQTQLKKTLDLTVESCVNFVGVDLNTASSALLSYVSGIGKTLAQNIVDYRAENGEFRSRKELKKVAKLGNKAYEQAAGFLRIRNAKNPLDNSAIHPESYKIVETIAKDINLPVKDIIGKENVLSSIKLEKYVTETAGMPTLQDIKQELSKPGLDPRKKFETSNFSSDINEISDLKAGMILEGTVTNVTNFGAFVDIGVHQDGLVHISQLSDKFVKNPYDIVSVGDNIKVKVISVEADLKRISLAKEI